MNVRIEQETAFDTHAREALLNAAFGAERFAKTCERLREGRLPADQLALTARLEDRIVGTLRFWHVEAGDRQALLLGPLAVAGDCRSLGIGGRLMRRGLTMAGALGHKAVLLVGDEPYYARFGFERRLAAALDLPGPYDPARFLGLELQPGGLSGARGLVSATGRHAAHAGASFAATSADGDTEADRV